ncbi:MAG: 50S ribosomal protein L29 [Candidatus Cloacimonetes bacterium]|nr:50S ribosomal protein L29 [Candidatus Cloacimonadota bacterium]
MKADELRQMTKDELERALEDNKESLFNLRFQKARNALENKSKITETRRVIARINTLLTEKKNS